MHLRSTVVLSLLIAGAAACSGASKSTDTTSTKAASPSTPPGTSATTTAAAQPITGKTWDVKMYGDATGYRFDPVALTIKRGDGVRWTVVNGAPHNVTFPPDSVPQGAQAQLQANMAQTVSVLTSEMLLNPSQTYTVSFAGVAPGSYHYYCTPHLSYGMRGVITVQ